MVQTQHFVGFRHHQMQVMGDHQHGAVQFAAQLVDQIIKRDLTIDVHALGWLIQHQQLRAAQQRTGQQNALRLTAGQLLQRRVDKVARLHALQRRENIGFSRARTQTQKTIYRQRQGGVQM
jgi:hypothetical protein